MLPDRTGLGPLATLVAQAVPAGLCPPHGGPAARRSGGSAHEILDPRDLKYCRNRCSCHWDAADDPFRSRDRLPFARWGLAELQLMGWPLLALTILLADEYRYLAMVPAVCLCLIVYFFRDPLRSIPGGAGLLVAPADGRVVEITSLPHDELSVARPCASASSCRSSTYT